MQLHVLDTNYQAILNTNLSLILASLLALCILIFYWFSFGFTLHLKSYHREQFKSPRKKNRLERMPREFKLFDRNHSKYNYWQGKYHLSPRAWYHLRPEQAQAVHSFKSCTLCPVWSSNWLKALSMTSHLHRYPVDPMPFTDTIILYSLLCSMIFVVTLIPTYVWG